MEFVETTIFTRQIIDIFTDDEYRLLQNVLTINPEAGKLIPNGGGLRKVRWAIQGRGKSGGVRAIYYWATSQGIILMLYMYRKSDRSDLTPTQIKALRQIIESEYP